MKIICFLISFLIFFNISNANEILRIDFDDLTINISDKYKKIIRQTNFDKSKLFKIQSSIFINNTSLHKLRRTSLERAFSIRTLLKNTGIKHSHIMINAEVNEKKPSNYLSIHQEK
jgi:hypothetical protein